MDIYLTFVVVFISVLTTFSALRRGADTAGWEWRWRSLDPEERDRIVAAATSTSKAERATLVSSEEIELGAGYRRRRRRRLAYIEMPVLVLLLVLAALVLDGVVSGASFAFIAGVSAGPTLFVAERLERRMDRPRSVSINPDAAR